MRISRAIAIQSLAVCAGLLLITAVTIFSWSRYEDAQADAGRNSKALQDFRLLEETAKSWLLNNDLVYASDQIFLIQSTRRQGQLMIEVADSLRQTSLGLNAGDALSAMIQVVELNQSELLKRQFLSPDKAPVDAQALLRLWDQRSLAMSYNQELAREQLQVAADARAESLYRERIMLMQICVVSYLLFALLVIVLWRWLTASLAKPLSDLTQLAESALLTEECLDLAIAGPTEVKRLTRSINAFIQRREELANERASELEEQKQKLETEVQKRIRAERAAQGSARSAEAASRAKSLFLANMSHEIRTPLNGIIGCAEILTQDHSPEKLNWGLQNIQNSSHHLLALLNQILDFSKIEAGGLELESHHFLLNDMLAELRSIFDARAADKNVAFVFDISPDIPLLLEGDSLRIRQILTNLLGNAFTYTEQGHVILRCIPGEASGAGRHNLVWEVEDSGIGIPLEQQSHIFESFRQADTGTTRAYGGTGLGLTISKQLVELMGGKLEMESEPGRGSVFRCTMELSVPDNAYDLADEQQAPENEAIESESTALSGHVLLAEDNLVNQEVTRYMLEQLGFDVSVAGDGKTAVEMSRREDPDLILMDWHMPHMDGVAATRKIREFEQAEGLRQVPIIMFTADTQKENLAICMDACVNDFLPKPVQLDALRSTLTSQL